MSAFRDLDLLGSAAVLVDSGDCVSYCNTPAGLTHGVRLDATRWPFCAAYASVLRARIDRAVVRVDLHEAERDRTFRIECAPRDDGTVLVLAVEITDVLREASRSFAPRLVHELRNVGFGLSTLIEGIEPSRSADDDASLMHTRDLSARLATLALGLEELVDDTKFELAPIAIGLVLDAAFERTRCSPAARRGDESISILADGPLLVRALAHLLENARAVSPPGFDPTVEVRASSTAIAIAILDHGPPLRDGQELTLWEPLVRRRKGGSGFGLAIARRLVALQGGSVSCASVPGAGVELVVNMPRT